MVVAGSTRISYVVGKGVSRVKNYTQVLDCISRGNRISEKLSREFIISPDESRGYIGFRSVAPPPPP